MKLMQLSFWAISLSALSGCSYLTSQVDKEVTKLAAQVQQVDIHPANDLAPPAESEVQASLSRRAATPEEAPHAPPEDSAARTSKVETALRPAELERTSQSTPDKSGKRTTLIQAVALQQPEKQKPDRVVVPPNLPGAKAPLLERLEDREELKRMLQRNYPPLPPAPQLRPPAPGPEGRPMTLADLQRLAALYSPAIKSAESAVQAAKGAAKQAGAYPNPTAFFEQDTVGTGSMGYQGFGSHLTVMTAGKLKLQQASAMMDLLNAQVALKRAYIDLSYAVRTNYFAVLVAREGVKINQALYEFSLDIFQFQIEQVEGLRSARYEPMQLRPLILQARFNLIQAQNQYLASWKQLAAAMGLRDMQLTEVAGRVDMAVPVFEYNEVRARVLANHTDVRTAYNNIEQAKFNLRLAQVTPIPNVDLNLLGQKDGTAPPNVIAHSLQASVPIPIFNQNLGGIKQATGLLAQALAAIEQTRNTLTQSLADAYNRFATNREYVAITLQQAQDQLRVYRHMRERYYEAGQGGGLDFTDLFVAQQALVTYISNYIAALGMQWLAVCDVANLLQTDDLFQVGPKKEMAPVPDLKQLAPLPGLPLPPCPSTSSQRALQDGKDTWPILPPSDFRNSISPLAPTETPDEQSAPTGYPAIQPTPVAQPADPADGERSREAKNPMRGRG
jgi:cobalt-zinc-cadmium efflux system outer membrane protein